MIDRLILHNCILGPGAFGNVMPLKVMHYLALDITRPYKNVCGFDSRSIPIYGIIKYLKDFMATNKDIFVLMNVVVIDVPDV